MTPRQLRALELHNRGLSFAAIGAEMGVSRQTALEHVRKAQAFSVQTQRATQAQLESAQLGPVNANGGMDIPMTVGIRGALDMTATGGWTPSKLAATVTAALQSLDTGALFSLFREMERKDANYRSVKETRVNQVCQLPDVLTPVSKRLRDRKVSEWLEQFIQQDAFQDAKAALMEAVFDGAAMGENIWGTNADGVVLDDFQPIEGRHLVFSKADGRTIFLAPTTHGGQPVPVGAPKVAIMYAKKGGVAIGGGLGLVALWAFVLKWLAKRDWASLSAVYGKPSKIGKYKPGSDPREIAKLRSALAQLGSDAAALIPDTMVISFEQAATVTGSAEVYERFIRYLDEQVAKLILGASLTTGTSNTGSGGSQALGNVHNELRYDIMRADAKLLARALRLYILKPAVEMQFGEGTPVPLYELQVEEPEDLEALATVAEKGQKMGLPLSKKALAKRLGLPLADENDPEDLLVPIAAPAAESPDADPASDEEDEGTPPQRTAANSACPVHGAKSFAKTGAVRDGIDDLVDESLSDGDWETVSLAIDEAIQEVASQSTGFDDLRVKLAAFVESGDVQDLRLFLTQQKAKARLAAAEGVDLTAPSAGSGAKD